MADAARAVVDIDAANDVIHADIGYLQDGEAACRFATVRAPVEDMRSGGAAPDLDREGYAVVDTPSVVKHLDNEEAVRTAYYAQSEAIIRSAMAADRVIAFDHAIRPLPRWAHNDDAEASGPRRAHALLGEAAARSARFAIVSLWRPIGGLGPAAPIAVAAADSLDADSFVSLPAAAAGRMDEAYALPYAPGHRWRRLSDQRPEEALLIKSYDSALDGRARFTARAALKPAEGPRTSPPAPYIGLRALVCFDA